MASEDLNAYAVHCHLEVNHTVEVLVKTVWMNAAAVYLAWSLGLEECVDAE